MVAGANQRSDMSICRFGAESAVYVFYDVEGGLTCCGCSLYGTINVATEDEMIAHLDEHVADGDLVPEYAYHSLLLEKEPTKKTRIEYVIPGSFFSEYDTIIDESGERNIEKAVKNAPAGAVAFSFYAELEETVRAFGEQRTLQKRVNNSCLYYIGGDIFTAEEVAQLPGDYKTLLSNMKYNDYKHVIRTRRGNFQPFFEGSDILISE